MDQANYLSAACVYEKLGMHEKVREYSEMYKVSVRSILGEEETSRPTIEEYSDDEESHDSSSSSVARSF